MSRVGYLSWGRGILVFVGGGLQVWRLYVSEHYDKKWVIYFDLFSYTTVSPQYENSVENPKLVEAAALEGFYSTETDDPLFSGAQQNSVRQ